MSNVILKTLFEEQIYSGCLYFLLEIVNMYMYLIFAKKEKEKKIVDNTDGNFKISGI